MTGAEALFCPKCGAERLPNAEFCYACGTRIPVIAESAPASTPTATAVAPGRAASPATPAQPPPGTLSRFTLPGIALALAIALRVVDYAVANQRAIEAGYLGVQMSLGVTLINVTVYFVVFYAIGWVLRAAWHHIK